jgi:hypothetical protein
MRSELRGASPYGSVSGDARSNRPNDERKDAGKEAEAEQTVFAQARKNGGERDEK